MMTGARHGELESPATVPDPPVAAQPAVIHLADAVVDPAVLGGKAAALAQAWRAGLNVLPGIVLTTAFCHAVDEGDSVQGNPAVRRVFHEAGGAQQSLIARSSSPLEDQVGSSMAGQFESVLGIDSAAGLESAISSVLASRERASAPHVPIAVLVQPLLEPAVGGVAFGIDPVSGRSDRRVITATAGGPAALVSGETAGSRYVLDEAGGLLEADHGDGPAMGRDTLGQLAALVQRAGEVFGAPQDVEWAIDGRGELWLLQSRPVTSENLGVPSGPVFGPGPVAETFPEPLTELERDLWVPPLRDGVRHAVVLTGGLTTAQMKRTEVIVEVDGRVAIDLRLTGEMPTKRGLRRKLNPLPAARRLGSAWRVGRLRSALPHLSERLLDRVDADLETVPALEKLTSRQLIALLHRGQGVLRALHAHEVLTGMLGEPGGGRLTGASVALRVLSEARADGLDDEVTVQRSPVVLALTAPAIRPTTPLPRAVVPPDVGQSCEAGNDTGVLREALRLRARWIQELTGRAAWTIGERLARQGDLPHAEAVRHLNLDDLEAVVTNRASTLASVISWHHHEPSKPLPARFQMSDRGRPIAVRGHCGTCGGTGAGGGTGTGPVTFDLIDPPARSVLVTTTLTPALGPVLPRLGGVVAETGSVLSHLAILAREFGIPIVVGYPGATAIYQPGEVVTVNGDTGDVTRTEVLT